MRQIREPVLAFTFNSSDKHLPKTVRKFRQKYKRVSDILDAHPEILMAVHKDLRKLSVGRGRVEEGTSVRRRSCGCWWYTPSRECHFGRRWCRLRRASFFRILCGRGRRH